MICTKCKEDKNQEDFSKSSYHSRGFSSQCKSCAKQSPSKSIAGWKKFIELKRHKISLLWWLAAYKHQESKCEICGQPPRGGVTDKLVVDHDHNTKQIRGLLCDHCNRALGQFRDDPIILQRAIEYVKRYQKQPTQREYVERPAIARRK